MTTNSKAFSAPASGKLTVKAKSLAVKPLDLRTKTYNIPLNYQLLVKTGDEIKTGTALAVGSLNPSQLLKTRGLEATQRYILLEIAKVFALQGSYISSKHLEIIISQMFSRVIIDHIGDSHFIEGDIVSLRRLKETNEQLLAAKQRPALYSRLVLGITKINSISESFLVAASFQDTTRVLIKSSISGQVDHLQGLIENVVLGRKIPVGTGARSVDSPAKTK